MPTYTYCPRQDEVTVLNLNLDYGEKFPYYYTGIIQNSIVTYWYFRGKRHRTEGPAWEWANGSRVWWVDGKFISAGNSILLVM